MMKAPNELYVAREPDESIGAFMRRYKGKTTDSPSRDTFERCFKPIKVYYTGTGWSSAHEWLREMVPRDEYVWYGHHFFFMTEEVAMMFRIACSG